MTIQTTSNKAQWQGNGATTVFSFSFLIASASQATLYYEDASGNITIIPSSSYTISGLGSANGGTVTYPLSGSPIASGTSLTLVRSVALQQLIDLINQDNYYPDSVELGLDYLMQAIQQISEVANRAVVAPDTDTVGLDMTLPSATVRASALLGFDANGKPVASAAQSGAAGPTFAQLAASTGASLVGNTPAGNVASTTVQAAINELDTEKLPIETVPALTYVSRTATATEHPRVVKVVDKYMHVINQALNNQTPGVISQPTYQIFDINVPGSPVLVSTTNIGAQGDDVRALDVVGKYAYLGSLTTGKLYIYDIGDPIAPSLVSTTTLADGIHNLTVRGGMAFIGRYTAGYLDIWDVSNAALPVNIAHLSLGTASVIGNYLYGKYWYTVTNTAPTRLIIADVSNPVAPVLISSYVMTGSGGRHVYVSGRYAYVANITTDTLEIVDVKNPASPATVSSLSIPLGGGNTHFVRLIGKYALVGANGVTVVDCTNPAAPTIAGSTAHQGLWIDFYRNYLYCADYTNNFINVLSVAEHFFSSATIGTVQADRVYTQELRSDNLEISGGVSVGVNGVGSEGPVSGLQLFGAKQSYVRIYQALAQAITANTVTKLTLDTTDVDRLGEWDIAQSTLFPKYTGIYLINVAVTWANTQIAGNETDVLIYVNGVQRSFNSMVKTGAAGNSISNAFAIIPLNAGDNLDIRVLTVNAQSTYTSGSKYTFAEITRVS